MGISPFFISHECLLLRYESALVRSFAVGKKKKYYNAGAHFLWLGERTRHIDEAHVEFLRGIENPIGIKLSAKVTSAELVALVKKLNPDHESGKIVLIPRLGKNHVQEHLPRLIQCVQKSNLNVVWFCDPMHGNGEVVNVGKKTRRYENILSELLQTVEIHKKFSSCLSGLHLELTEHPVTECLGGNMNLKEEDLLLNYQSLCDPRLNPSQSIQLMEDFLKFVENSGQNVRGF